MGTELKARLSQDEANAIARKFDIPPSSLFREELEQAAEVFESLSRRNRPRIADQEKELKLIVKQTEELIQSLRKLSPETRLTLVGTDVFGAGASPLFSLSDYLSKFRSAARVALGGLLKDKGGVSRNDARALYIGLLAGIFRRATGQQPTCTYNAYAGQYESPFLDFVVENLRWIYEELPSNAALGKQIQRVLRGARQQKIRQSKTPHSSSTQ